MIVVSEWMDLEGLKLMRQIPGELLYEPEWWAHEEILKHGIRKAQGLVIRNNTRVTNEVLDQAPLLKVIGRLGAGLDNIDMQACHNRHVQVVYARGANAIPVVEYVLGALLYGMRPWLEWARQTKAGTWQRQLGGRELNGKTLGVIGLGDIGSRVARAARILGMTVEAFDPHLAPFHALITDGTVSPVTNVEDLVEHADALTIHAPLRPDTYHMLNQATMARFKTEAILINTARGALIDESALVDLMKEDRLGMVFLDVRESEPPGLPDPLARFEKIVLTPHLAGLTGEAQARTTALVLEDVVRVLTGRVPRSPVRFRP